VTHPVEVFPTAEEIARRAASLVEETVATAIAERGVARIALSGGSTPRPAYEILGRNGSLADPRVEVYFADERCVPPADHASNYKLVAETVGDAGNVRRIRGEIDPDEAAIEYEATLRSAFGTGPAAFDLLVLGIGGDGHTASLFPGEPELEERARWVVATKRPHQWVRRVTLTLPVLNAARSAVILAAGRDKAKAVAALLGGGTGPAARVLGARLLLDEAAAEPPLRSSKKDRRPATDELLDLSSESDGE
jgi:6-phosphogluconolactonase